MAPVATGNGGMILALAPATTAVAQRRQARRTKTGGQVPHSAFACIGRLSDPGTNQEAVPLGSTKSRNANDNFQPPATRKSVWRELFFLTLLAITIAGAFWGGRMHNYQRVIVVPGPSSFYSVVT